MKNKSITKCLKQGEDISNIRKKFYETKLSDVCYVSGYYNYCRCTKSDFGEIVKNLSGTSDLNCRVIPNDGSRGNNFLSGQEILLGDRLKYSILLYRIPGKRSLFYMSSILILDDMEFYVSPYQTTQTGYDSDGFGAKLLQIAAELPQWNAEWQKMNADILKLRKRLNVGASTIESVLPVILEELGYPYYTEYQSGDTYLYVKLPYHRCLCIKLKPEMDMTKLMELAENIKAIDEALKKMGNIYLKVRNYGNDIKWNK